MIGKLKGLIDSIGEGELILDVNGVGYVVAASARTLRNLPGLGEAAALYVETQMREDSIRLFGFLAEGERDWFRLLQSVQGVGAKVALAILGALSAADLASAVALQDKAAVARAQGVGPKLAARIVAELKDKAPALGAADLGLPAATRAAPELGGPAHDAVLALVNLGYARPQATLAVAKGLGSLGVAATTAALIRHSLKELAQ
ncbi:MAG TPA: Holliday junction branch migration protein RuvA [Roseiarcus sp.]|jgi:Holliday junction DNA helicase RuvA|nr:Holliday junction branch migration protein RuvA [Roseiarcus sp.]